MPDLLSWVLLAALGLLAGGAIAWPLLRPWVAGPYPDSDQEAEELRHRIALEALLDVEADRRAGSLDDAAYARQRAEAEERAALTLAGVGALRHSPGPTRTGDARRPAALLGVALAVALLVGYALPEPAGLAERSVVNQPLAAAQAREADRQVEIQRLLTALEADPLDAEMLSGLADAYLAGGTGTDLNLGAVVLQFLIGLEPEDASAYQRLVTAYITAGDWADAQAATDAYAAFAGEDEPDIPFFRGLIALRSGDNAAAVRLFDAFLLLAPHDERASMVVSLRAQAARQAASPSPSPGG